MPLTLQAGWNTLLFQVGLGAGMDRPSCWLSDEPADRVRAFADRGQWDQALALVRAARERQPDQPAVLLLAGRFFRRYAASLREQGPTGPAELTWRGRHAMPLRFPRSDRL